MGDEEKAALGMILRNLLDLVKVVAENDILTGLYAEKKKIAETDQMIYDAFEADHSGEED